jgi:phage-related protein
MATSPSRTLKLTYLGDASQLSKSTKQAGDDVKTLGERAAGIGKVIGAAFLAVGAAGIAMGKKLFDAFEQVSTANARIEAVVTSMGNFEGQIAGVTERLVKQAEATARLTGVDRNLIKESQALLLTFDSVNKTAGEAGGVFDRATQAAVDLAAAGFGSVTGNAQQLGKALEDPIKGLTALTRSGVTFTAEQQELIRALVESNRTLEAQDIILGAIEKQVGGVAEATANGSAKIRQAFGILVEQIATRLAPAFESLVEFGLEFVEKVARWWDINGDRIIESFARFRDRVAEVVSNFRDFVGLLVEELRQSGSFERLRLAVLGIADSFGGTLQAADRFFSSIAGPGTEAKASAFARYIDFYLIQPLEALDRKLGPLLDLINRFLDAGTRLSDFFQGRGQFSLPGGDFTVPEGFVPGTISPTGRTQTSIVVNVSGAIDPEGTARTIERTLANSQLRLGAPTRDLVGVVI